MRGQRTGFLSGQDAQQLAIQIAGALFGIALVLSLQKVFERPAAAGQVPGYMWWVHLDANGPFRFVAALALVPILCAWGARIIGRSLGGPEVQGWSVNLVVFGSLTSLWVATFLPDWKCVVLPTAIAIAVALLFRRVRAGFSRRDLILLPSLFPVYFGLLDLTKEIPGAALLILAATLLLALRMLFAALARETSIDPGRSHRETGERSSYPRSPGSGRFHRRYRGRRHSEPVACAAGLAIPAIALRAGVSGRGHRLLAAEVTRREKLYADAHRLHR